MAVRYRLSVIGLAAIRQKSPDIKNKLALALECSEGSINRYIRENCTNGELTKLAALEVLKAGTGLEFHQILEDEKAVQN